MYGHHTDLQCFAMEFRSDGPGPDNSGKHRQDRRMEGRQHVARIFLAHFTKTHLDEPDHQAWMATVLAGAAQPSDTGTCAFQGAAKRIEVIKIIRREPHIVFHDDTNAADGMLIIERQDIDGFCKAVILIGDMIACNLKALFLLHKNMVTKPINL